MRRVYEPGPEKSTAATSRPLPSTPSRSAVSEDVARIVERAGKTDTLTERQAEVLTEAVQMYHGAKERPVRTLLRQLGHSSLGEPLLVAAVEVLLFEDDARAPAPEAPPPPREPDHKQVLTTEDRNGYPIPPTCAHCGKAEQYCEGEK